MGLFAFFLLMQIPFVFSLDSDICHDVSRSYRSDCRGILHMDISDHDKLFLIDYLKDSHYRLDCKEILHMDLSDQDKLYLVSHLKDSYYISDVEQYPSLFSGSAQASIDDSPNYNPKENLNNKFSLIFDLFILFLFSYCFYCVLKKGFRGNKWNVE